MRSEDKLMIELTKERAKIKELIIGGLYTDGAHHKQWYINEIRKCLKIVIHDNEIEKYGEIGEGIAPGSIF